MKTQIFLNKKKAELIDKEFGIYQLKFKNESKLTAFYQEIREKCFRTNFALNPYEWAAHGFFKSNGEVYCLSAPTHISGDNNWYKYSGSYLANVRLVDKDELEALKN
jgi:hypothetical protein